MRTYRTLGGQNGAARGSAYSRGTHSSVSLYTAATFRTATTDLRADVKKMLYKIWSKFLTMFGNIKVFKWPLWIVYDPDDFEVTGEKTAQMLKLLEPGDVVVRGYKHYADGKFIPSKSGWSHGAVYVGDWKIVHAVTSGVQFIDAIEFARCDRIAVLRPSKNAKTAVRKAKKFVKDNVPYDFFFRYGSS